MGDKIRYEISMTTVVATYWFDKFAEFKDNNPEDFGDLTFAEYIGEQVLASMKLLFDGLVPDTTEEQP